MCAVRISAASAAACGPVHTDSECKWPSVRISTKPAPSDGPWLNAAERGAADLRALIVKEEHLNLKFDFMQ